MGPLNRFEAASDKDVPGAIWSRTYGGPDDDHCFDLIEVSTGGFAMTGYTDMDWTVNMGILWLVRTDEDGNQLWNRTYTEDWSWGHSILECNDGGFLIAGKRVAEQPQIWLVRTDASGNHLWNRTCGGVQPSIGYVVSELTECADGGFAIFGSGPDNKSGDSDYYLVRIDVEGNLLWNHTYNHGWMDSPADKGLVQCSDGGFAIVGYTRGVVWESPYSDVWLVRTDANGNHLWNLTYGGPEAEFPYDILRVDSDFVILLSVAVEGGEMSLLRFEAEGNVTSDHRHVGFAGSSMVECTNGGFAVAGGSQGIDHDGSYFWEPSLLRTDDNGDSIWEQTYGRGSGYVMVIVECSDGNFAMAGSSDGDFWLLRVVDQAPLVPLEWILVGIGVPVAMIAIVAILRARRK